MIKKSTIILVSIICIMVLIVLTALPVGYRLFFMDMELNAMEQDCLLKFNKIYDGSPQGQAMFTDNEGVLEDQFAYSKTDVNSECFKLINSRDKYELRYLLFGKESNNDNGSGGVLLKGALEFFLIVLVGALIVIGVCIVYNKIKSEDDEDDEDNERGQNWY